MADQWEHRTGDDDGLEEYELIIPDKCLYLLTPAYGAEVWGDGERVDGAEWYVDFSRLHGDPENPGLESQRFITTEAMTPGEAKAWALRITA